MTFTGMQAGIVHVLIVDDKAFGRVFRANKRGEVTFAPPPGNKWSLMPVYGPKDERRKK